MFWTLKLFFGSYVTARNVTVTSCLQMTEVFTR